MPRPLTVIVPYYRQPLMLAEQLRVWAEYPAGVAFIVIDDGSPEPALPVLARAAPQVKERLTLLRINVDVPWNRGGARNLGTSQANTLWIVHLDLDHVLPAACVAPLLEFQAHHGWWYHFERFRNGTADSTRRKDALPDDVPFGKVKPHGDSYLCSLPLYVKAGGYDEDYSGCLGGGSPFLRALERVSGAAHLLPPEVHLHVYTRSVIADASVSDLSRDVHEYRRRKLEKERGGRTRPTNPIRFPWTEICIPT